MRNTLLSITMVLVALGAALAQTKSDPKAAPKAASTATAPAATKAKTTATTAAKAPAKAAGPNLLNPASLNAKAPPVYLVKLNTTKGPVVIRVTKAWAPNAADRFYNLVRAGFFTDAAFFRTIKGFMAQFGIPARPDVNRVWENQNLKDEPALQSNKRGFVTFAQSSEPNSRSTQIFIGMRDNSYLDADHFAPFGEVIEGMDVVDMLYSGYGDANVHPGIEAQGKAYLDKNFPRLDRILTAVIEPMPDATKSDDAKK